MLMERDNIYIRFDWAMKHMLRDKANFDILEGFLSVLLNQEVHIEEILESESNQDSASDKFNRVDIKAKNSKGHIILIEVQLTRQLDYLRRVLFGTCKTITDHINLGDSYGKVKKVYAISILYCDFGQGDDYVYHGTTEFKGLHTGTELVVNTREDGVIVPHYPREVFPEYYLLRINSYSKIPETPLEEWMDYLKTGRVKEETRTPGLQAVKKKLRYLSMTPEERKAYEAHIDNMLVQDDVLDTAHREGFEEGVLNTKIKMVKKMNASGFDIDTIASIAGIALEEVRNILAIP